MGLYDTIMVFMKCPYCKRMQTFDAQTKDLGNSMFTYHTLPKDWHSSEFGQRLCRIAPVFPEFPLDKSANVWKSQAEKRESQAAVPEEYSKKKHVKVIADCHSPLCQAWAEVRDRRFQGHESGFGRMFEGKVAIKGGLLSGEIYDIIHVDKSLPSKKKIKLKKAKT
jgi:glutaredoxin